MKAIEANTGFALTHRIERALFDSQEYRQLARVHGELTELAGTPAFTVRLGDAHERAASFEALREAVMTVAQKGIKLQRFKGLGEMNADQLGETTMAPATRMLAQVTLEDAAAADRVFSRLMGDQVEPRREFIEENARTVANSGCLRRRWHTPETLSGGNIEPRALEEEMRTAYLDYAMSVIVGRALPDVRDGLKPVHRRVLYAMNELGLGPTRSYAKCAQIVGEVMGKYHPHGDSAIYDTLVRMAQEFSMRNELVDGQGNFGSVDDDPAAAMRYTEARLARIATEMLRDLDMDTVDFAPNYDGSKREPLVLPARFPNLLVNGSSGIAVGMATNIPPHNLREVIDATVAYIDDPEIDVDGLMRTSRAPTSRPAGSSSAARASATPTRPAAAACACRPGRTSSRSSRARRRSSSPSCRSWSRRAGPGT